MIIGLDAFWLQSRFAHDRGLPVTLRTDYWLKNSAYGLREPPLASQISHNITIDSTLDTICAEPCFMFLLKSGQWMNEPTDKLRWHWLSASLRMLATKYSFIVHNLQYSLYNPTLSEEDRERCYTKVSQFREHIEATMAEVQGFIDDNCKVNCGDFELDLKILRRVMDTVKALASNTQMKAERTSMKKTIELSELAMSESRSAIACKSSLLEWSLLPPLTSHPQ